MTEEIREATVSKGGTNERPTTPRPEPPEGQGCEDMEKRVSRPSLCPWCGYVPGGFMDAMIHVMEHFPGKNRMGVGVRSEHWRNAAGNPTGGCTYGVGYCISWQNGPLGQIPEREDPDSPEPDKVYKFPNGAFVEDILAAARDRLECYQASKFACPANAKAIEHIDAALDALDARTQDRVKRGVEGTYEK